MLPFRLAGQTYLSCTTRSLSGSSEVFLPPRCPTRVDNETLEASPDLSDWGTCDTNCPLRHYLTTEQIEAQLRALGQARPEVASVFTLGQSVRGLNITGLRLTRGADRPRALLRPLVWLVGNMHGNEVVGREILTHLALLLATVEDDPRLDRILQSSEVHIVPSVNPDGWARATVGECGGQDFRSGRLNENRVDLNRNFPQPGQEQEMEPETQALVSWLSSNPFVLGANFHDGAVVASYPWDHYTDHTQKTGDQPTLDDGVFRALARLYADNSPAMSNSSSCLKYSWLGPTTNGAAWYPKNGTLKDWSYRETNSLDLVLELSCCKFPVEYFLPRELDNNRESLLRLLEQVQTGVRGLVSHMDLTRAVGAVLGVTDGHSQEWAGKNVTVSDRGEFWRLLLPGSYSLQAWAGCLASPPALVTVTDHQVVTVNITLSINICV